MSTPYPRRWWIVFPSLAAATVATPARAVEGPSFQVGIEAVRNIYTATPADSTVPGFKPHINFPWLEQRADGTLEATYSVGQTHGVGHFGQRSYSYDGGINWTHSRSYGDIPVSQLVRPGPQLSFGVNWGFEDPADGPGRTSWTNGSYLSNDGGSHWTLQNASFNTGAIPYVSTYNGHGDIVKIGNTLLITGQGMRAGSSTFESVLFASTNNGVSWTRRSTIAAYVPGANTSMGSEGPSESSIVQLNNGNLLSVVRTGQPFPNTDVNANGPSLFWTMSGDLGQTWSQPKMLGVGGVFPLLQKLDDGSVALTYGRYGAKMMFADETGLRWSKPSVIYDGPSSGHTEMRKLASGRYAFVYDQSSFYPPSWDGAAPPGYVYNNDQSANLKAAILNIQRQPVSDPFPWAVNYHGDVTPDALPQPWTRSQGNAGESAYLWADLGQDYLRTDTRSAPGGTHLYYTAPDAQWQPMNFNEGVVLEMRSRVSGVTAEGSADLVFGDGVNGYGIIELTSTGVILEGLGGNASQSIYTEAANPGFATDAWHDYRIVVAPDGSNGVLAKVYLDGDFATPILTGQLAPSTLDSLYFGDLTSTNNGILDVDYLRVARHISQWRADADGAWSVSGNWALSVPGGNGAVANFLNVISAPRTVTIDAPRTAGTINFEGAHGYTLAGTQTLTLDAVSGSAAINVASGSHTIAAPLLAVDHLVLNVTSPASTLTIQNLQPSSAGITKVGPGAAVLSRIRGGALTASAGTLKISPNAGVSDVTSLSVNTAAAARLDLTNNAIIASTPAGTASGGVYDGLQGLVQSARNGGAWDGAGLTTSLPAAVTGLTSIGVATGAQLRGLTAGQTGTFAGQTITNTSAIAMYTYAGDANLDGFISGDDYAAIDFAIAVPGASGWFNGDFNYDGIISGDDYAAIDFNIVAQGAPFPTSADAGHVVAVPEPATTAAIAASLLAANVGTGRRRRGSA